MNSRHQSALVKLRRDNEWRVIEALRGGGGLSRAELTRVTGLSRSTVADLVGDLAQRGVVDETHGNHGRHALTGRPGVAVALRPSAGTAFGVAVDRESIRVAAFDLATHELGRHTEFIT